MIEESPTTVVETKWNASAVPQMSLPAPVTVQIPLSTRALPTGVVEPMAVCAANFAGGHAQTMRHVRSFR